MPFSRLGSDRSAIYHRALRDCRLSSHLGTSRHAASRDRQVTSRIDLRCSARALGQPHACQPDELDEERVLKFASSASRGWPLASLVVPIAAVFSRRWIVAHASQVWVREPSSRSSGATGPPILGGTHPGSTAFARTFGRRRASAKASAVMNSLPSQ